MLRHCTVFAFVVCALEIGSASAADDAAPSLCGPVPIEELSHASFAGTEWRFLGEAWRASGAETHVGLSADGTASWHDGDPALAKQIVKWEFIEDPNQGRGLFLLGGDGARIYAFPTRSIESNGATSMSGVRYGGDEQVALLPVCPQPAAVPAAPAGEAKSPPSQGGHP